MRPVPVAMGDESEAMKFAGDAMIVRRERWIIAGCGEEGVWVRVRTLWKQRGRSILREP